ncbi:hypothetical protein DFH09DRAFT_1475651 [Mycena vulgaris]|nr:hypothetical protein DFH09DRAFT_1475651 [Mycena vulgaris]
MHSRCQRCGPTKPCKINASGTHHPLSNNQLRAWARSLAAGTHGVTMQTPPKAALFATFFRNFDVPAPVFTPQAPANPMGPYMTGNPFPFMPWGMPPSFTGPGQMTPAPVDTNSSHASSSSHLSALPSSSSHASTSSLPSVILSSDPPDMAAANPYAEISAFLTDLSFHHPRRNLPQYIPRFEDLDFYNIDEILKLGTAEELTRLVDISAGNAAFLLVQVKTEMKRVDRIIRASKV